MCEIETDWPAKYPCSVNCCGNQDLAGLQLQHCAISFAHRGDGDCQDDQWQKDDDVYDDYIVHNYSNDDYIVHNDDNDDHEDEENEDECDS